MTDRGDALKACIDEIIAGDMRLNHLAARQTPYTNISSIGIKSDDHVQVYRTETKRLRSVGLEFTADKPILQAEVLETGVIVYPIHATYALVVTYQDREFVQYFKNKLLDFSHENGYMPIQRIDTTGRLRIQDDQGRAVNF